MDLVPIGVVESSLVNRAEAPFQGHEGGLEAWLVFDERFGPALEGLARDDEVFLFTWLHQSERDILRVHPRRDPAKPEQGVFSTRSPVRPNPIGLHRVRILAVEGLRLRVRPLEAVDQTPIVDVKPVIDADCRPAG